MLSLMDVFSLIVYYMPCFFLYWSLQTVAYIQAINNRTKTDIFQACFLGVKGSPLRKHRKIKTVGYLGRLEFKDYTRLWSLSVWGIWSSSLSFGIIKLYYVFQVKAGMRGYILGDHRKNRFMTLTVSFFLCCTNCRHGFLTSLFEKAWSYVLALYCFVLEWWTRIRGHSSQHILM